MDPVTVKDEGHEQAEHEQHHVHDHDQQHHEVISHEEVESHEQVVDHDPSQDGKNYSEGMPAFIANEIQAYKDAPQYTDDGHHAHPIDHSGSAVVTSHAIPHNEAQAVEGMEEDIEESAGYQVLFSPVTSKRGRQPNVNKDIMEKRKAATKAYLRSVIVRRPMPEDATAETPIGLGREYLYVTYCTVFKSQALAGGIFWTMFNDMYPDLKAIHKNPRIKLNKQSDVDMVFPGLKLSQIPVHQDERFRYLPGMEMNRNFVFTEEWKAENAEAVMALEQIFGPNGPPPVNMDEVRAYFNKRRENVYEAFYNPWSPAPQKKRGASHLLASSTPQYNNTEMLLDDIVDTKRQRGLYDVPPQLKYDIWEDDSTYIVLFDAPGIDCEKLGVIVFPSLIKVSIPKQTDAAKLEQRYKLVVSNRTVDNNNNNSLEEHMIQLPSEVNPTKESRQMFYDNGTVRIRLVKEHLPMTDGHVVGDEEWVKGKTDI